MNNDGQEKTGTLSFLSADGMTSLLRVKLYNVGIYWFEDHNPPRAKRSRS
jgi:hypothetical protein